jgi:hypothetical protein
MALQATAYVTPVQPRWPFGAMLVRAHARFAASRLNDRLVAGEAPWHDANLSRRAAQLISPRTRRRIAGGLDRLCARSPDRGILSAAIPVDPQAVQVARPALEQLAAALRCRESVHPRGIILAQRLLTEPDSALYRPSYAAELYEAAREALFALG